MIQTPSPPSCPGPYSCIAAISPCKLGPGGCATEAAGGETGTSLLAPINTNHHQSDLPPHKVPLSQTRQLLLLWIYCRFIFFLCRRGGTQLTAWVLGFPPDHCTEKRRDYQCRISVTLPGTGSQTGPDGMGDAHPAATEQQQKCSPGMGSEILRQLSHPKRQPGRRTSPCNRLYSASELPRIRVRHYLPDFPPKGRGSAFPRHKMLSNANGGILVPVW